VYNRPKRAVGEAPGCGLSYQEMGARARRVLTFGAYVKILKYWNKRRQQQ